VRADGGHTLFTAPRPTWIAQGPWGSTVSGNVVGGILAWAIERDAADHELQPARLTVDLLRPTTLEPLRVQTVVSRQGRRIRLVDAHLTQKDSVVGLAALTHYSHAGVATGVATIFDRHGPIGSGIATAIANPGFRPPF
jgi:hypothetical protein